MRMRIPTDADGTTGHVWAHGALREAVRPLPVWWVLISIATFIFGVVYLSLYPGLGSFGGKLGWSSQGVQQRDTADNNARLEARIAPWRPLALEQLAADKRRSRPGIASTSTTAPPARPKALGNHRGSA
jgi:cytochrome c oxidase cbb3-type subunit 3